MLFISHSLIILLKNTGHIEFSMQRQKKLLRAGTPRTTEAYGEAKKKKTEKKN